MRWKVSPRVVAGLGQFREPRRGQRRHVGQELDREASRFLHLYSRPRALEAKEKIACGQGVGRETLRFGAHLSPGLLGKNLGRLGGDDRVEVGEKVLELPLEPDPFGLVESLEKSLSRVSGGRFLARADARQGFQEGWRRRRARLSFQNLERCHQEAVVVVREGGQGFLRSPKSFRDDIRVPVGA